MKRDFFLSILGVFSCYTFIAVNAEGKDSLERHVRQTLVKNELNVLFDDYWNWLLKTFPESGTWIGIHTYDDQLTDLSLEAYRDKLTKAKQFHSRAAMLRPKTVTKIDKMNLDSLVYSVSKYIEGYEYQGFLKPIDNRSGPQVAIKRLLERMPKKNTQDMQNMLARMKQVPSRIEQSITLMRRGINEGITNHNASMNKVAETIEKYIVENPEDSPLYTYFQAEKLPSDSNIQELQSSAKEILNEITLAMRRLQVFIQNDYRTRPNISISSLKFGPELYDKCIEYYVPYMTPQEIHDIGMREVEHNTKAMQEIIEELSYSGMSVKQFSDMIQQDENNYYKSSEELVQGCKDLISNRIESKLSKAFNIAPKASVTVEGDPLPSVAAYYRRGSVDRTTPGTFVIGTSDVKLWPKYTLPSLTLHEANPGHHFQITIAQENDDFPLFRKLTGIGSQLSSAPSSFGVNTGFVEGWGLYSEFLGLEMGVFETPLERFGYHSQDMLRAGRLVVDTGMHALGWTREEAITFLEDRLPFGRNFIEIQVDRYITWPGQALAYKVGQLKISEWRERASQELGEAFDLKEFHRIILENPTNLEALEKVVMEWIEENKNTNSGSNEVSGSIFVVFLLTIHLFVIKL